MKLRTDDILDVLDTSGQLFARFTKDAYLSLVDESAWGSLMRVGVNVLQDDYDDVIAQLALPPSFEAMESTHNNLFTGGMPLAALPVESLYQVWSSAENGPFGRRRGLYQAECAFHIRTLCATLDAQIPQEYQASPDHLVILLELVALFLEVGNSEAAAQLVRDHLSWLDSYAGILKDRAAEALCVESYSWEHRANLEEGILFYRSLVILLSQVLRELHDPQTSSPTNRAGQITFGQDSNSSEHTALDKAAPELSVHTFGRNISSPEHNTSSQNTDTSEQNSNNKTKTREVMHV